MIMRRRPLLRAAVVGGGAYAMGKRSARRSEGQDQQAQQQQAPGPAAPAQPSMLDQLNQLTALHQQGSLTDAEFDAAKAKLLGS
jgi:membrane protease subunit (stomatin/prohibitin family)